MNINRNPTLVGLPRVIEPELEPFPLCNPKRSGVLPIGTIPRDTRGTHGSIPVYIPPARRRSRPQEPEASSPWKDGAVAASVVFMLGAAIVWWAL
jgi:hypothetical protein